MKKLVFALAMVSGFAAHAGQVPAFKCQIASATQATVTLTISVSDNESVDFVTVDLNDKAASQMFMQMDKGSFAQQIAAGGITTLVLDENFSQEADGVIRNSGILSLSLDQNKWGGLLAAHNNIYPLACTKL